MIRTKWLRHATPDTLAATRQAIEAATEALDLLMLRPGLNPFRERIQDRAASLTRTLRAATEKIEREEFERSMHTTAKKKE